VAVPLVAAGQAQDRIGRCAQRSEPHLGRSAYAAAISAIASLAAISGSEPGTTESSPPRVTGRPHGARPKPVIGLCTADLGTRQA